MSIICASGSGFADAPSAASLGGMYPKLYCSAKPPRAARGRPAGVATGVEAALHAGEAGERVRSDPRSDPRSEPPEPLAELLGEPRLRLSGSDRALRTPRPLGDGGAPRASAMSSAGVTVVPISAERAIASVAASESSPSRPLHTGGARPRQTSSRWESCAVSGSASPVFSTVVRERGVSQPGSRGLPGAFGAGEGSAPS